MKADEVSSRVRVLTGVTLIDGTGRAPIAEAAVVIEGDRIARGLGRIIRPDNVARGGSAMPTSGQSEAQRPHSRLTPPVLDATDVGTRRP